MSTVPVSLLKGVAPADVMDYVVRQGNGVTGLSRLSLETIPTRYIQAPEDRLDKNLVVDDQDSIPVIDVSCWDDPKVEGSICEAAANWGFFQVLNHGVPIHVLDNALEAARKFFELPTEERRRYLKENSPTDTIQLKSSFRSGTLPDKVWEWKDFLSHSYIPDDQSVNLWPAVSRVQVLEFIQLVQPVMKKTLQVLLRGLNMENLDKSKEAVLMGVLTLNLMHYPKCPNPELTDGVGPHADISSITVLVQDEVGGLYARKTSTNEWMLVKPVRGALVINIGDVLQVISNGRYSSVEHRVIVDKSRDRVSVPIFANADQDAMVGPFPEALQNGDKPIYRNFIFSEYFNHFFTEGPEGKKTIEYVKI